jgi:hypothetical protein
MQPLLIVIFIKSNTCSVRPSGILKGMADSLFSILNSKDFDEPPEVRAIKEYVRRNYDTDVNITMQPHSIVVAARSAALIGSLRMNLPKLQEAASTDKRIIFRVG